MTKKQAAQIRAGIIAASRNEVAPSAYLSRMAYRVHTLQLIAQQANKNLRRTQWLSF